MNPVSNLEVGNRIHVFKHLSVNELDNGINMAIFENLLNEYYSDFINFCETIKSSTDNIKNVSCYIENGEINFDVKIDDNES